MTDAPINMILTGIVAFTSIYATHRHSLLLDKVESCADSFMLSDGKDYSRDHEFVNCMQGNFPNRFAEAYVKKLKADAKLKQLTTSEYQ
jgi:hypothetical protein